MHTFLGGATYQPHDEARYSAVTGAHILHAQDTYADLRAGYFNIPREVLDANAIGPTDVSADAYRDWVRDRSQLARTYLDVGRAYFQRIESWRHGLAGLAYIARFEWLVDRLGDRGIRRPADVRQRREPGRQAQGRDSVCLARDTVMTKSAIVIGSGIGVSAAIHLAQADWDVTVIEQNDGPGGRCGSLELDGHRFDTGPTLMVMPLVYEAEFRALGASCTTCSTCAGSIRPISWSSMTGAGSR